MSWDWLTGDPTRNLHGVTAYGQTYGGQSQVQPAQPAVPPGGAGPAPAVTPGGGGPSSIFSTTPTRPQNVYLSPEEQAAILKAAGYAGGTVVGGQAIPQPKLGKNVAGADVLLDTGEYQVSIQDANGRNIGNVTVTKGQPDEGGNPTWGVSDIPKTPTTTTQDYGNLKVTDKQGNTWFPNNVNDPGGGYKMIVPAGVPNADDEIKKAVDRQVAEGDRNARARNEAATGIYGTDKEVADIQNQAATQKLNQAELQERIRQFNQQHKYDDQQQKIASDKAASDLQTAAGERGLTTARTAGQVATTAGTEASTAATLGAEQRAAQEQPGKLAQQGATLEATNIANQQAKQTLAQGRAPTLAAPQTGMSIWQRDPNTGAVTPTGMNPEYVPKTQAEIAARVGQIQQVMTQKQAEVQGKVGRTIDGKQYTADDALNEFNAWKAQNVTPQADMLQAAQESAAQEQARLMMTSRTSAYAQANEAAQRQIDAFKAVQGANAGAAMARPGYAEAVRQLSQGKVPTDTSVFAAQNVPANPADLVSAGAMNALKYIDPRAAAATGAPPPNYGQMNIPQMLGVNPYTPPGMPTPGAPGPASAATPAAPAPSAAPAAPAGPATGTPDWWNNLMGRQQASAQEQAQQRDAMMPDWLRGGTPPGMPQAPTLPTPPAAPNFGNPWSYAAPYTPPGYTYF